MTILPFVGISLALNLCFSSQSVAHSSSHETPVYIGILCLSNEGLFIIIVFMYLYYQQQNTSY